MGNEVKIKFGADGAGFARGADAVKGKIEGVAHSVKDGLKDMLFDFAGAASVGLLIKNMMDFAESIMQASDRLGIATDRVQELRIAARHAGKDLGAFDAVFQNLEKNASKALVAGSKEGNAAAKMGLTDDQLKHQNKDELLKTMLEKTKGMERTQAESLIGTFVGKKNAGWLVGNREELLSGSKNIVKGEDLKALDEFKDTLEDLGDIVKVAVIPALLSFVRTLTKAATDYVDNTKDLDSMDREASMYNSNHNIPQAGFWKSLDAGTDYQAKILMATGDSDYKQKADKAKQEYIERLYGADTYKAIMATHDENKPESLTDELEKRRQARRKARDDEDARLKGPVERDAPITATKKQAAQKELLSADLGKGSEFNKIGGFLGIGDASYRMERLSQKTNDLLQGIQDRLDALIQVQTPDSGEGGADE